MITSARWTNALQYYNGNLSRCSWVIWWVIQSRCEIWQRTSKHVKSWWLTFVVWDYLNNSQSGPVVNGLYVCMWPTCRALPLVCGVSALALSSQPEDCHIHSADQNTQPEASPIHLTDKNREGGENDQIEHSHPKPPVIHECIQMQLCNCSVH